MAAYPSSFPSPLPEPSARHLILVRRRNARWEVVLDGVTRRMIDWLCTRDRALEHALEMASVLARPPAGESVRVVVEDVDGAVHTFSGERNRPVRGL
jgi:hypothetical protein